MASADALDALALVGRRRGVRDARALGTTAAALRAPRHVVAWGYAADTPSRVGSTVPEGWVVDGDLSPTGVDAVVALFSGTAAPTTGDVLDRLTTAERHVADRVATGMTSRQIAEELFVSPRTVDAHPTHIYRKLDISDRARLAALVAHRR